MRQKGDVPGDARPGTLLRTRGGGLLSAAAEQRKEGGAEVRDRDVLDRVPTGLFIGGGWREADDGARFPVEDPATGARLADVADGGPAEMAAALDAAAEAQRSWGAAPPPPRAAQQRGADDEVVRPRGAVGQRCSQEK
uniref:aldehyde dehydrogenase family protein n=1 Tax=Nocardia farcinica TaxID=37329 RepID=UPI0024543369